MISPMGGENQWPLAKEVPILPQLLRRMPGRPKRNRRKDPSERVNVQKELATKKLSAVGRKISCSICKGEGHNKRKCPSNLQVAGNEVGGNTGDEWTEQDIAEMEKIAARASCNLIVGSGSQTVGSGDEATAAGSSRKKRAAEPLVSSPTSPEVTHKSVVEENQVQYIKRKYSKKGRTSKKATSSGAKQVENDASGARQASIEVHPTTTPSTTRVTPSPVTPMSTNWTELDLTPLSQPITRSGPATPSDDPYLAGPNTTTAGSSKQSKI